MTSTRQSALLAIVAAMVNARACVHMEAREDKGAAPVVLHTQGSAHVLDLSRRRSRRRSQGQLQDFARARSTGRALSAGCRQVLVPVGILAYSNCFARDMLSTGKWVQLVNGCNPQISTLMPVLVTPLGGRPTLQAIHLTVVATRHPSADGFMKPWKVDPAIGQVESCQRRT